MKAQRGFALIEAVIVIGIVAACAGALLLALANAAKSGTRAMGPNHVAALRLAAQTLRVAANAWKYGSLGDAPSGTEVASVPVPLQIVSSVSQTGASSAVMTVTVSYTPDPGRAEPGSVTLSGTLRAKAPLPGARVEQDGLISAPGASH